MTHRERSERREIIAKRLREGASFAQMVEESGLSFETIRSIAKGHNIKGTRPTIPERHVSSFRIVALLQRGLIQADVARELNISRERVRQIREAALEAGVIFP